jgi:hypothetical protein
MHPLVQENQLSADYDIEIDGITDEQDSASAAVIDSMDPNKLASLFSAFVQSIKSGMLSPNIGHTTFDHSRPIMTSDDTATTSNVTASLTDQSRDSTTTLPINQNHDNVDSKGFQVGFQL